EKSENLRSELREGSRRLQALEWQSAEVQTALESFRNELGRFTETNRPTYLASSPSNHQLDKLELRVDNLAKGIQLVVAALKGINSDIGTIKGNVTTVVRNTRFIVEDLPKNCKEVQKRGYNISGIYRIQPELAPRAFMVLCDMSTKEGGWTYIHNRYEGVQDFYLNWHNYKLGFGNLGGEFWLGLEYLHQLTGYEVNELLVELVDMNLKKVYAHYGAFSFLGGAWWYKGCDTSNLNGKYLSGDVSEDYLYQGMYWGEFHGAQYSLFRARMMVRPRHANSPEFFPKSN
ncbi:techylectin-5B-like, partial [Asbolus verrucosus]